MKVDAITIYVSIIAFSLVSYLIGWVVTLLQIPGIMIRNRYISKYYQLAIGIASDLFQIYLLCCIPVYCLDYTWDNNLTITVLSFILIGATILVSVAQNEKSTWHADEIERSIQSAHSIVRAFAPILIYAGLFCLPHLAWETPVAWFVNACSWVLNIPIIGFIVKLLVLPIAGYYILTAIVGIGSLVYKGCDKISKHIKNIKENNHIEKINLEPSSIYPLKWFHFCVYFRYPFGVLLAILRLLPEVLNNLNESVLWSIDIFVTIILTILVIKIVNEGTKFTKVGLRSIYTFLYITAFYNAIIGLLYCFIDSANAGTHMTETVVNVIIFLLELKYYNRRKSLFVHTKEKPVRYRYNKNLAKRHKQIERTEEEQAVYDLIKKYPTLSTDQIGVRLGMTRRQVLTIMEEIDIESQQPLGSDTTTIDYED